MSDSIAEPKVSKSRAIAVLFRTPEHGAKILTACSHAFGIPGMQVENTAMTHPNIHAGEGRNMLRVACRNMLKPAEDMSLMDNWDNWPLLISFECRAKQIAGSRVCRNFIGIHLRLTSSIGTQFRSVLWPCVACL